MVSGDLKIWNYDFFSHYCATLQTIKKKKNAAILYCELFSYENDLGRSLKISM